jgi:hypothetical protein
MAISQGLTRGFQRTESDTLGLSIRAGRGGAGLFDRPAGAGSAASFSGKGLLPLSRYI